MLVDYGIIRLRAVLSVFEVEVGGTLFTIYQKLKKTHTYLGEIDVDRNRSLCNTVYYLTMLIYFFTVFVMIMMSLWGYCFEDFSEFILAVCFKTAPVTLGGKFCFIIITLFTLGHISSWMFIKNSASKSKKIVDESINNTTRLRIEFEKLNNEVRLRERVEEYENRK